MPRVKKVYTEQFQVRLKPINEKFVREETVRIDVSLSYYVDTLLEMIRQGKIRPKITRPVTLTEKRARERELRMKARERMKKIRDKKAEAASAT